MMSSDYSQIELRVFAHMSNVSELIDAFKKGYDIHLSIDIDLQSTLDNVLKNTLSENGGTKNRENFQSLFTTVLNSKDGSVLAMSGYQMDLDTKDI